MPLETKLNVRYSVHTIDAYKKTLARTCVFQILPNIFNFSPSVYSVRVELAGLFRTVVYYNSEVETVN